MTTNMIRTMLLGSAALAAPAIVRAAAADDAELLARAKVSLMQAIEIASKEGGGGLVIEISIDEHKDAPVWEAEVVGGENFYELVIDAVAGSIIKSETGKVRSAHADLRQAALKANLTLADMVQAACADLGEVGVFEAELELRDAMLRCEIDYVAAGKKAKKKITERDLRIARGQQKTGADAGRHATAQALNFDGQSPGEIPPGWSIQQTRPTAALATWGIAADDSAPSKPGVFALTHSENFDGTFNLAIWDTSEYRDLDLSVKVKAVAGNEDQGGGPIWRCRGDSDYYVCRFNPLEGNFRVYVVAGGNRKQLATADVETEAGKWYTVRVTMKGEQIECYLDGTKLLEATDGTFKEAGRIGLWTKADAVTSFDDLSVAPLEQKQE